MTTDYHLCKLNPLIKIFCHNKNITYLVTKCINDNPLSFMHHLLSFMHHLLSFMQTEDHIENEIQ